MNVNVYQQIFNMLIFIIIGIIIGVLFDFFRIIRKSFKTPDFITYIEDTVFWILAGIILLFSIFTFNNGEIRVYIFVGLLLGFITYLLTLSKYVINTCVKIVKLIKKIIYFPIKKFVGFITKCIIKPIIVKFKKWDVKKLINNHKKNTSNTKFPNNCHKNS